MIPTILELESVFLSGIVHFILDTRSMSTICSNFKIICDQGRIYFTHKLYEESNYKTEIKQKAKPYLRIDLAKAIK